MKNFLIFLSLLAISSYAFVQASQDDEDLEMLWELWKEIHQIPHGFLSAQEDAYRFQVFKNNYDFIQKFNAKTDRTHTVGLNKFANLTQEEFRQQYTNNITPDFEEIDPKDIVYDDEIELNDIPSNWDWRQKGAVTDIFNQGQCDCTWADSAVTSAEAIYFLNSGNLTTFSRQQVLTCTNQNYGCHGGYAYNAYQYIAKAGLETQKDYPYNNLRYTCDYNKSLAIQTGVTGGKILAAPGKPDSYKALIYEQPISMFVDAANQAFQFYWDGVITTGCGVQLDHTLPAIGYGTAVNKTDSFYLKNQWGKDWGMDGYVYVGTNATVNSGAGVCGILAHVNYPTWNKTEEAREVYE